MHVHQQSMNNEIPYLFGAKLHTYSTLGSLLYRIANQKSCFMYREVSLLGYFACNKGTTVRELGNEFYSSFLLEEEIFTV